MPQNDLYLFLGLGGFFVLLGIGTFIWGRGEEKGYYSKISSRADAREFLDHWPRRPQFEALKIGGRIFLAIGVLMVLTGAGVWLWG